MKLMWSGSCPHGELNCNDFLKRFVEEDIDMQVQTMKNNVEEDVDEEEERPQEILSRRTSR